MKIFLLPKKCLLLLLFCLAAAPLFAQSSNYIDGTVTVEAGGQPIPNCSVYFNNTSNGDITDANGAFKLRNAPQGKYELVISAIGYQTLVIPVSSDQYPYHLNAKLKIKASDLSAVTIQPSMSDGWEKYGDVFLRAFIGMTPNASSCRILNTSVIKFWYSDKTNRVTARADEPLIIENRALGYTVKYKLEQFVVDFNDSKTVYIGYPFFEEQAATGEGEKRRWQKNRREAFNGSILQFMRSLYSDLWAEEGFHIITKVRQPNLEKERVRKIHFDATPKIDTFKTDANGKLVPLKPLTTPNDSSRYYKKILKQPDFFELYVSLSDLDSLLTTNGNGSKSLFFHDKLKILYQPKPTDKLQQSEVYLVTPEPIVIEKNGSYYSPREFFVMDRWAQYEKLANALPIDYNPD
jgi:hypothetical protein